MYRFSFILIALLCVSLKTNAFEFRVLGLGIELADVYYAVGTKEESLQVPYDRISEVYRFPAGHSQFELYLKTEGEQEGQRIPVAQIAVPTGLQSGILVFLPPRPGHVGLRTTWIDDSGWKGDRNAVFFFNFSSLPVGIRLSEQQWVLQPGQTEQSRFTASTRSLRAQIAAHGTEGWGLTHTNRMPVRDGYNLFVFLRDGVTDEQGDTSLVDVVRFYEAQIKEPAVQKVATSR